MKTIFNIIALFILLVSTPSLFGAGTSDDEFIIGKNTGTLEKRLCLNKACTNVIRVPNGGGNIEFSNDGSIFLNVGSDALTNIPDLVENAAINTSVAANALTIALKQADGSTDPVALSLVRIAFRDLTVDDGAFNILSISAALNIVIPSGATLRHLSGADGFIYVYALDNAGTIELAVSSTIKNEHSVQSSTILNGSSDNEDLYSTVARTNVPIRLLTRLKSNQVTVGTWALDVTENSPGTQAFTETKVEGAPTANTMRTVAAHITNTGTPAVASETGAWIVSLVDEAVGDITVNFTANVFSDIAYCTCTTLENNRVCALAAVPGSSSTRIRTFNGSTGALEDQPLVINCHGEKGSL